MIADLHALTALPGPSGDEAAVVDHVLAELRSHGLPAVVDALGNVVLRGPEPPVGLITAHVDQVGFMVSRVEADRALCLPVGDATLDRPWPARVVAGGETKLRARLEPGEQGSEAVVLRCDELDRVDVGDRVLYDTEFQARDDGTVQACALDDRVGCWVLLRAAAELAAERPDLAFAWTVREELEGAGVIHAARTLEPSWTVSVDATFATDGRRTGESSVLLGGGPAITLLDGGMVVHRPLLDTFTAAATEERIRWQPEVAARGTSEAGMVQSGLGIPGLALLVPVEAPHSPVERASVRDLDEAYALLVAALRRRA